MGALGIGPELSLGRGRVRSAGFDFGGGVLPAGASLARASSGSRIDGAGLVASAGANVARFDHDPATLALRGLLVEGQATNRAKYGGQLDQWLRDQSGTAPTVTAAAATAPDGTFSATGVALPAVAAGGRATFYRVVTATPADSHTASVWLKGAAGGERVWMALTENGGIWTSRSCVLTTGWERFAFTVTLGAMSYYLFFGVDTRDTAQSPQSAQAFSIWGAQFEQGASASSYIATAAAEATRAADVLALDWTSLGVADGAITLRCTFDDGSTQDLAATVAGGTTTVPAGLARRWLRRVERL